LDTARTFDVGLPTVKLARSAENRVEVVANVGDWDGRGNGTLESTLYVMMGSIASREGVSQSIPDGSEPVLASTTVNEFRGGNGDHVTAIAMPCTPRADEYLWRTQVHRTKGRASPDAVSLVAEVTQRYVVDADNGAARTESGTSAGTSTAEDIASLAVSNDVALVDRRQRQIFEGACEVIARKSWAKASIRDIAQAAKIPVATMYQYIHSKDDMLYLVTSMCMEEILSYFQEKLDEDSPPAEALSKAIDAYFKYIEKNRRYINLLYSETRSLNTENREKIFHLEKRFMAMWEAILIRGKKQGVFNIPNTDLAANLIYFLCTVWALRHWSIGHYASKSVIEEVKKMILGGITKAGK